MWVLADRYDTVQIDLIASDILCNIRNNRVGRNNIQF